MRRGEAWEVYGSMHEGGATCCEGVELRSRMMLSFIFCLLLNVLDMAGTECHGRMAETRTQRAVE